jgi:hypothetical protein
MFKSKESIRRRRRSKGRNPECRFRRIPTDWNCIGILCAVRYLLLYFRFHLLGRLGSYGHSARPHDFVM